MIAEEVLTREIDNCKRLQKDNAHEIVQMRESIRIFLKKNAELEVRILALTHAIEKLKVTLGKLP
jgi:hypothetical protein